MPTSMFYQLTFSLCFSDHSDKRLHLTFKLGLNSPSLFLVTFFLVWPSISFRLMFHEMVTSEDDMPGKIQILEMDLRFSKIWVSLNASCPRMTHIFTRNFIHILFLQSCILSRVHSLSQQKSQVFENKSILLMMLHQGSDQFIILYLFAMPYCVRINIRTVHIKRKRKLWALYFLSGKKVPFQQNPFKFLGSFFFVSGALLLAMPHSLVLGPVHTMFHYVRECENFYKS